MIRLRVPRFRSGNFKPLLFRHGGMYSEELIQMLIQLCMRNVINKIENRINKESLKNEVWKVYSSGTEEEFMKLHKKVIKKWSALEPEAIKQFEKINHRMLSKYQFDIALHKELHTNNTIERYFREIRRRIKAMGVFETVKSADKLLFLIIEYLNQRRDSVSTNCNLVFYTLNEMLLF